MTPLHDYHVHSNYSDGAFLWGMAEAADDLGLGALGFADHCNVAPRDRLQRRKELFGFNLDATYERRRRAIDALNQRGDFDVRLFDGVEMDYDPADEREIARFLEEAGFDYTIGSIHYLDGVNVHVESYFSRKSEAERRELVESYFDKLVALADSELFEVAAHPDLVERNPAFRGLATQEMYDRAAEAFSRSRTVPEVNAGRALRDYGELHPNPRFLDTLLERDVAVTAGTDSHDPDDVGPRRDRLVRELEKRGIEPVEIRE